MSEYVTKVTKTLLSNTFFQKFDRKMFIYHMKKSWMILG